METNLPDGRENTRVPMHLLLTAFFLCITSATLLPQCFPFLGQLPPGSVPIRLVPDTMAANNAWQYHGTPAFSPDGDEMYYSIYRYNPGRVELWFTQCNNGKWSMPALAPFAGLSYLNNNPYFSRHRDTLYFLSPRTTGFIHKVTRNNGVWSTPIALDLPIPSGYNTGLQFSIADNGNVYAELSYSGAAEDIYLWRCVNGQYQQPQKVTGICSQEIDFTPFIDPAERYILFSSRRPGGIGNTDMYFSRKLNDGSWSLPVNLGPVINSGDVIAPVVSRDGNYLFFDAWMPDAAGGNPYWMKADIINRLLIDSTATSLREIPDRNCVNPPGGFSLNQNYPNPFNPSTTIEYDLKYRSSVTLEIFNSLGEIILQPVNEVKEAGHHKIQFNASRLPGGIYLYRLASGEVSLTKTMTLLK